MSAPTPHSRVLPMVVAFLLLMGFVPGLCGADDTVLVQLDVQKAGPRAVEALTAQRVVRDYKIAWASLSEALEHNTTEPLEGPFVGYAKRWLAETVASQQHSGLSQRYLHQSHKLTAVFYAPEGDVIELHDDAQYQVEILDHGKTIHDQPVIVHYVALMTPGADRWVVRQLQAVPEF
jgi:hypothetical protein